MGGVPREGDVPLDSLRLFFFSRPPALQYCRGEAKKLKRWPEAKKMLALAKKNNR